MAEWLKPFWFCFRALEHGWYEILKRASAHVLRPTIHFFLTLAPPCLWKSVMFFQSLKAADVIKWKIIGTIENPWHKTYTSTILYCLWSQWDSPEKDENTGRNGSLCWSQVAHILFLWKKMEDFIQYLTGFFLILVWTSYRLWEIINKWASVISLHISIRYL